MNLSLRLLFFILAIICFVFAAAGVEPGRPRLVPLGLAFLTLGMIVG